MRHVFIIEEDFEVQRLIEQALSGSYKLTTATSGEEAIQLLTEEPAELILMPEAIAGQDGLALYRSLRKLPGIRDIPVLFVTARGDTGFEQKAYNHGVSELIILPCSSSTILNRVKTQLELKDYRTKTQEIIEYQDAISVSIAELVECRDITTGGHLKNTTAYFKLLLEEVLYRDKLEDKLRINQEDYNTLLRSAPLHDIGKIGINDDILRKASTLENSEFEYMKTHTILAKETFDKIMQETGETRFLMLARDLAYSHHERWDGTGYPNGLKGEEIPLYARILAIADVYDALTSHRTYKKAFSHEDAKKIILQGKGTLFDPELVDIFMEINNQFEQALGRKYINGAEN